MGDIKIADVGGVALFVYSDFDLSGFDPSDASTYAGVCIPSEHQETTLTTMLDEILAWSHALRILRDPTPDAPATPHTRTDPARKDPG
jgi:hypothetical protein